MPKAPLFRAEQHAEAHRAISLREGRFVVATRFRGAILFEVCFYLLQLLSMIWDCDPQYRGLAAKIIVPLAALLLFLAVQKLYF